VTGVSGCLSGLKLWNSIPSEMREPELYFQTVAEEHLFASAIAARCDYSCIYTLIHSFLTDLGHGISALSGDSREISFLYKAAANKEMKYSGLANSHLFFPVIIETSRVTNQLQAVDLV